MAGNDTLFELRDYVTQPGRRDELIDMFEQHFLDEYERSGAAILATFRRIDVPDHWTWIRCFAGPAQRALALNGFYTSPLWLARRDAANATIYDVGDSRLLRAIDASAIAMKPVPPWSPSAARPRSVFEATLYPLDRASEDAFIDLFASELRPLLASLAAEPLAAFVTDHQENSYPRLPIRADTVFVTLARFDSLADHRLFRKALSSSRAWRKFGPALRRRLNGEIETKLLQPTARSALQ